MKELLVYDLKERIQKRKIHLKKLKEIEEKYDLIKDSSIIFKNMESLMKELGFSDLKQLNRHLKGLEKIMNNDFIKVRTVKGRKEGFVSLCTFEIIKLLSKKEIMELLMSKETTIIDMDKMLQNEIDEVINGEENSLSKIIYLLFFNNNKIVGPNRNSYYEWEDQIKKLNKKIEKEYDTLTNGVASTKTINSYMKGFWNTNIINTTLDDQLFVKREVKRDTELYPNYIKEDSEKQGLISRGDYFTCLDLLKHIGLIRLQLENEFIDANSGGKTLLGWLLFIVKMESRDEINEKVRFDDIQTLVSDFEKNNPIYYYFFHLANNLLEEKCLFEKLEEKEIFDFTNMLTVRKFLECSQYQKNELLDKIDFNQPNFNDVLCCNYFNLAEFKNFLKENKILLVPYNNSFVRTKIKNNDLREYNMIMNNSLKRAFDFNRSYGKVKAKTVLSDRENVSLFNQVNAESVLLEKEVNDKKAILLEKFELSDEELNKFLVEFSKADLRNLKDGGYLNRMEEIRKFLFKIDVIKRAQKDVADKRDVFNKVLKEQMKIGAPIKEIPNVLYKRGVFSENRVIEISDMKVCLEELLEKNVVPNIELEINYKKKKLLVQYFLIISAEIEADAVYSYKRKGLDSERIYFNEDFKMVTHLISHIAKEMKVGKHLVQILKELRTKEFSD